MIAIIMAAGLVALVVLFNLQFKIIHNKLNRLETKCDQILKGGL